MCCKESDFNKVCSKIFVFELKKIWFRIKVNDVINYHNLYVCLIDFVPYIKLRSKMRSGHDSVDN